MAGILLAFLTSPAWGTEEVPQYDVEAKCESATRFGSGSDSTLEECVRMEGDAADNQQQLEYQEVKMSDVNSAVRTTDDQVPVEQGQLGGGMKYCHGCGKQLHASAQSCPSCGAAMRKKGDKTKVAAALFAFFLGGFGAHRFYLGHVGLGILYLLFFWTFIPAIVAFFEFIYFLAMSDETFDEKYN